MQQALAPEINWATLRVLSRNGVEVIIPHGPGLLRRALHAHRPGGTGTGAGARDLHISGPRGRHRHRRAGCGSGMHEYPTLFHGLAQKTATAFAAKALDIDLFCSRLGMVAPQPLAQPLTQPITTPATWPTRRGCAASHAPC